MNNQWFSKVAVWLVIALVLFTVFKQFDRGAVARQSDRLFRFPGRSARQAHQVGDAAGRCRRRHRDRRRHQRRQAHPQRGHLPLLRLVGDLINNGVKFDASRARNRRC